MPDYSLSNPELRLRPGVPADAEAIASYHHDCRMLAFAPLLPDGALDELTPTSSLERWQQWLSPDSDKHSMVVEDVGEAVAHVVICGNELLHLFVNPTHWRQGLGQQLLAIGEQMLAAQGHEQIILHTMVGNTPAITMYERNGWTVTDILDPQEINGMPFDEHLLRKDLRGD